MDWAIQWKRLLFTNFLLILKFLSLKFSEPSENLLVELHHIDPKIWVRRNIIRDCEKDFRKLVEAIKKCLFVVKNRQNFLRKLILFTLTPFFKLQLFRRQRIQMKIWLLLRTEDIRLYGFENIYQIFVPLFAVIHH